MMKDTQRKETPASQKNIIVFVAHSDDEVLGCGGTIAHYAKKGYTVHTIICSFGELSHPHLKPEVIRKTRVIEAQKADVILGGSGVSFLGLKEGKFLLGMEKNKKHLLKNLIKRFEELKPEKVFTHDNSDSHPDHRATHEIVQLVRKKISFELYTFHIWTIINRRQGKTPLLCVDISEEFSKKLQALHIFRSQISVFGMQQLNNILYIGTYVKAFHGGRKIGKRYAEVFHKL